MPFTFRGQVPCAVCEQMAGRGHWVEVTSSARSVAFVPSRQLTAGTTLVVPRRHALTPDDLPAEDAEDLWLLLRAMVGATMAAFQPPSYHVSQYVGAITQEPLDHLSWRLEPRYELPPAEYVPIEQLPRIPTTERRRQADMLRAYLNDGLNVGDE